MDKDEVIKSYGLVTFVAVAFILTSSEVRAEVTMCSDGLDLNYTLPIFNECQKKGNSNGLEAQTIPKLIRLATEDGCPRLKSKLGIFPGHRVCRIPDCEKLRCKNGWCEETIEGYECHCSPGFQGQHCDEVATSTTRPIGADTTPPNVTCIDDVHQTIELGIENVPVIFTQPSATDMSGSATLVSRNYSPGDEFPVGSTIVKYVFSDESGNQASCIFTVIISTNDTTPPDITCVDDIFETIGLGTRSVRVHFTQPSATDISGNATLIFKNYDPGDEFPVGSTGVTYVFVDGSGNQATCNFTVAIDTEISNSSLGLENGNIPDSSLTASSFWGNNSPCSPKMARLHIKRIDGTSVCGSWSSGVVDSNQWIQVDLLTLYRVHGVATQGREDWTQWVTSYKINCSKDGLIFDTVKDFTTKTTNQITDKVFVGNYDHSTVVYNAFPEPIVCRYVRLLPMSWYHHISLRMELYGDSPVQDPEWHCISRKCYRLDTGEKSWKDARNYCHSLSAVITITGPKEPSLLFADTTEKLPPLLAPIFIDKFSIWINCNDKQEEGNFTCDIDGQGTKEGKQSWAPGEPNGDPDQITGKDEDCAAVSINPQDWVVRGWYDIICSTLYSNTICQIRLY